jgi:hypothetical protein
MKQRSSPLPLLRAGAAAVVMALWIGCGDERTDPGEPSPEPEPEEPVGGDDKPGAPEGIEHSTVGRWTGTTGEGNWIEITITAEGTDCCQRYASGSARIAAPGSDTLEAEVVGLSQIASVFFNLRGSGATFYGQFSGEFVAETRLNGTIVGPEAFGEPRAGPFPAEGEAIQLNRD